MTCWCFAITCLSLCLMQPRTLKHVCQQVMHPTLFSTTAIVDSTDLHVMIADDRRSDPPSCNYTEVANSFLYNYPPGYEPGWGVYNESSLAAAQAWCCAQGERCNLKRPLVKKRKHHHHHQRHHHRHHDHHDHRDRRRHHHHHHHHHLHHHHHRRRRLLQRVWGSLQHD
jgi:hypothetical protein